MKTELDVSTALDRASQALDAGRPLRGTGFWPAVAFVRRHPDAADRYADRIGAIDRRAFEQSVRMRVPAWIGTSALAFGTAAGVAALPRGPLLFLGGFAAITLCSHSLAHWAVARALGIRVSHYFLGGPPPPRPGAKLDYATYLRVAPRKRALMHASGAVVTKLVPFALLPFAPSRGIAVALALIGAGQIVTDVVLSTKVSDWKKVRRELAAARAASW